MKKAILTDQAPEPFRGAPYSQGVKVKAGVVIEISGCLGNDPATGKIVFGGVGMQALRALQNLEAILLAGGGTWDHVVRVRIFAVNRDDFGVINGAYRGFLESAGVEVYPSRSTVGAAWLPDPEALVEIEATAIVPEETKGGRPLQGLDEPDPSRHGH